MSLSIKRNCVKKYPSYSGSLKFSVFILITQSVFSESGQERTCSLLDKVSYSGSESLQPRKCRLIKYDEPKTTECLSKLSDLKSSRQGKDKWHISFMGDSRVRQMYHIFNEYIPKYDVEVEGHMKADGQSPHSHANVTSSLVGFTASYRWSPYPDDKMEADLKRWIQNKQEAPDVLVTSQMLWTMQHVYLSPFEKFARNMTRIAKLLRQLSNTSTVIWWDQEYVKEKEFTVYFDIYKNINIDSRRIMKYNAVVRHLLEGSSVIIWDSTHHIFTEFERACKAFRRRDDYYWFWRCQSDAFHPGFVYINQYIQQLLNYLCNRVMTTDVTLCCSNINT